MLKKREGGEKGEGIGEEEGVRVRGREWKRRIGESGEEEVS